MNEYLIRVRENSRGPDLFSVKFPASGRVSYPFLRRSPRFRSGIRHTIYAERPFSQRDRAHPFTRNARFRSGIACTRCEELRSEFPFTPADHRPGSTL